MKTVDRDVVNQDEKQQVAKTLRLAAEKCERLFNNYGQSGMCLSVYCTAEAWTSRSRLERVIEIMERTYRWDSPCSESEYWMGPPRNPECQKHRIVALLMLADAIEQGDF